MCGRKAISKYLETIVGPKGKKHVSCSTPSADSAIISTVSSDLHPTADYMSTLTSSTAIDNSAITNTTKLPSLPDFAFAFDRAFA